MKVINYGQEFFFALKRIMRTGVTLAAVQNQKFRYLCPVTDVRVFQLRKC